MASRFRPFSFVGAGLCGGVAFLVVELLVLPPTKHVPSDWILRLIASLMAGPVALTAPHGLEMGLLAPALGMHAAFSLAFGYAFCRMEDTLPFFLAIVVNTVLAVALYLFNFHFMTRWFPWFATARGAATVLAHVVFGLTTVVTHKGLRNLEFPLRGISARA
jgi:hypothetical protein